MCILAYLFRENVPEELETGTGTDLGKKTGKLKLKSKIKCLIHKDDDSRNSVAVFVFQNGYRHIFVLLSRRTLESRLSQAVQVKGKEENAKR